MTSFPGKLIVFYGINNLGKSTQAKLLVERLKTNGYQAEYLKYPVYSLKPSGEILNAYLRQGNPYKLTPREAQIIYALNRDQYQSELIRKLKSGLNVIAEDYVGTGIAWGLGAGVEENFLKEINSHLLAEDLVFLFDGFRFKEAVENGHRHENDDDLTNKVRWAHLKLKEELGWLKINANSPIEEIHEYIWKTVQGHLEGIAADQLSETIPGARFCSIGAIINSNRKPNLGLFPADEEDAAKPATSNGCLPAERLTEHAKIPQKSRPGDAAYDLYAADYYSINPYGQATVATGIRLAIPKGHVGLIWDRSGLAAGGITTLGGVIDPNYRGEIKVVVKNLSEDVFNIVPGQKIAQIIIQATANLNISEEKITDGTDRAQNGFGSSGKF